MENKESKVMKEFAAWLKRSDERGLGRLASAEVADFRDLSWPPSGDDRCAYLIRFKLRYPAGCTAIHHGTYVEGAGCQFLSDDNYQRRPAEDGYALHCYNALESAGLIAEDQWVMMHHDYDHLLAQWPGVRPPDALVVHVAELSPKLNYGGAIIGLGWNPRRGKRGAAVLDGERSVWVPDPHGAGLAPLYVLGVHIGRRLLGFDGL
jgi:hypothetical protein